MPSYKEQYPDKWLNADHLQGKDVTITIKSVALAEAFNPMTNKKEMRLAASFPGREIQFLINKTNAQALEKITGTDQYDQWRDIRVTLRPGRAPNGKPTILLLPPQSQPGPVHGRTPSTPATPVHGRAETEAVEQELDDLGLDLDDGDVDYYAAPVHGRTEMEEMAAEADPKSGGAHSGSSQEDVFFTIQDLTTKVRELHLASSEPMTEKQHDYIVHALGAFSGKDGEAILTTLTARDVSRSDRAGADVGRYLYDLLREGGPYPEQTSALRHYCDHYVAKPKKQPA